MDNELIDVYTEANEATGIIKTRADIHRDGDWHRTVNVYIVDEKMQYLVLLCPPPKGGDKRIWGNRFGGHVSAGQDYDETPQRELKEEIGLSVAFNDLMPLGVFSFVRSERNREHVKIFYYIYSGSLEDLILEPTEVLEVEWMDAEAILESMRAGTRHWLTTPGDFEFVRSLYEGYQRGKR